MGAAPEGNLRDMQGRVFGIKENLDSSVQVQELISLRAKNLKADYQINMFTQLVPLFQDNSGAIYFKSRNLNWTGIYKMKLDNKYNIGDEVFYPAADLRSGKLIKSVVTGFLITEVGGKPEIAYQTKDSAYAIKETDVFDSAFSAKERLVEVFKEYRKKVLESVDKAIKEAKKAKPEDILFDGTVNKDETPEDNNA